MNKSNAEALVNQILEKSEGVFLYAERFCEDVFRDIFPLTSPTNFPQGLGWNLCPILSKPISRFG
jgi:hypothetical protein